MNKLNTFFGTLSGFQEITRHNSKTTKHVSSHQLFGLHDQGPSQPTKETSEREKMYVFSCDRRILSLSIIVDLSVGLQSQVLRRPTEVRKEKKRLKNNTTKSEVSIVYQRGSTLLSPNYPYRYSIKRHIIHTGTVSKDILFAKCI